MSATVDVVIENGKITVGGFVIDSTNIDTLQIQQSGLVITNANLTQGFANQRDTLFDIMTGLKPSRLEVTMTKVTGVMYEHTVLDDLGDTYRIKILEDADMMVAGVSVESDVPDTADDWSD